MRSRSFKLLFTTFICVLCMQSTGGSIIKKGGFLFDSMQEEEMDPMDITCIVKIIIYHGRNIHGLTVYFERNDTTQCTYQWGGNPNRKASEVRAICRLSNRCHFFIVKFDKLF